MAAVLTVVCERCLSRTVAPPVALAYMGRTMTVQFQGRVVILDDGEVLEQTVYVRCKGCA